MKKKMHRPIVLYSHLKAQHSEQSLQHLEQTAYGAKPALIGKCGTTVVITFNYMCSQSPYNKVSTTDADVLELLHQP